MLRSGDIKVSYVAFQKNHTELIFFQNFNFTLFVNLCPRVSSFRHQAHQHANVPYIPPHAPPCAVRFIRSKILDRGFSFVSLNWRWVNLCSVSSEANLSTRDVLRCLLFLDWPSLDHFNCFLAMVLPEIREIWLDNVQWTSPLAYLYQLSHPFPTKWT